MRDDTSRMRGEINMRSFRNFLIFNIAIITLAVVSANAQTYAKATVTGKTIEQQVRSKILKLPYYGVFDNIAFSVNGGTVTLIGKVTNPVNRSDAEYSIKRIAGVSSVVNNIEILSPSGFDDTIRRDLYRKISATGGLSRYLWEVNPDVRLIVEHGRITLEGSVSSIGDSDAMNIAANTVPGVFSVRNNLMISAKL